MPHFYAHFWKSVQMNLLSAFQSCSDPNEFRQNGNKNSKKRHRKYHQERKKQKSRGVVYQTHLKECKRRKRKKNSQVPPVVQFQFFISLPPFSPVCHCVKIVDLYIQSDFLFSRSLFWNADFCFRCRIDFSLFTLRVKLFASLKSNSVRRRWNKNICI